MNQQQRLFLAQAKANYSLFLRLKRERDALPGNEKKDIPLCCLLYQIQIAAENLAKAYLWRPEFPKRHEVVQRFLRSIVNNDRIRHKLGCKDRRSWSDWISEVLNLALEIEELVPKLAEVGPNHEYPWPPDLPTIAPINYHFPVWDKICKTPRGSRWLKMLDKLFTFAGECF
jgi:hypothetical protein